MTENEKMIFELLDNYGNALNEREINAAKSSIKKQIANMLLDDLISQGYKQDKAEALVGFLTRDAKKEVDYSDILGKFGGNVVIDKVSGLPLKELYSGYLIYDKYNDDIETLIINGCELKKQLDKNGKYDYDGQKKLVEMLDAFINVTITSLGNQPLATNAYKTYIKEVGTGSTNLMYELIDNRSALKMGEYVSHNVNNLPFVFCNLIQVSSWDKGPTLEEMEKLHNGEYGNISEDDFKLFESYVAWRYMYEVEQELRANGIEPSDYYEMMKELNKEPTIWDKISQKGDEWLTTAYEFLKGVGSDIVDKFNKDKPLNYNLVEAVRVTKKYVATARVTKYDPLILDLDGDGYNIETKELGANFDLDKNGFAEKINWTSRDGFLCLDLNGNGTIDDGGELFGDQTLLADGKRAKNGFEALAQYDSNGDGVIDAGDEIFDSLRVWVDADGNGVTGEGEMKTLAELGITSINLGYENVNVETGTEATIGNTATFTREDGTIGGVGELWVSSDLFDTVDNMSVEVSDEIKELPNVRSIGNVYSLHNAMALDETGELKSLVESFAAEEDVDKRMAIAEQILFFICGANDVAAGSRGAYIDAILLKPIIEW